VKALSECFKIFWARETLFPGSPGNVLITNFFSNAACPSFFVDQRRQTRGVCARKVAPSTRARGKLLRGAWTVRHRRAGQQISGLPYSAATMTSIARTLLSAEDMQPRTGPMKNRNCYLIDSERSPTVEQLHLIPHKNEDISVVSIIVATESSQATHRF
jgi:hypothetical protein